VIKNVAGFALLIGVEKITNFNLAWTRFYGCWVLKSFFVFELLLDWKNSQFNTT